jgi:hypothetical protein
MATMPKPRKKAISLELPVEQLEWLDSRSGFLMSRAALIRSLIAEAMQRAAAE